MACHIQTRSSQMTDPATETVSDAEIIKQVLNGEANALEHLLKKYQNHDLKIIKKHVPFERIEETAQETFVRAYQSLNGFKKAGSFKHWLSAITVRTCQLRTACVCKPG